MKARHVALFLLVTLAVIGGLVSCDLLGIVSIDTRITDFQGDLNMTDRTSAYLNFHPTLTSAYNALKSGNTIDTLFPVPDSTGTDYALTVTSETDPTAVLVTVSGGPSGFGGTHYLKLSMEVTGSSDNRIVTLELSTTANSFPGPAQIQ